MIRLLYLSQARLAADDELEDILGAARRNNPVLAVTGVLIYGGGWCMQLLEGPEHAVFRLYAKIIDDSRHTDPRVIHVTPASEAIFREWSMGLVRQNPLEFEHVAALKARRLETVNSSVFGETLKEFSRRLRASE